ncbi:hypothetical protein CKO22_16285 [Thiococcus pfennigii]|nr:hypothetical protein [Thiococcus pfennigii]
MRDLPPVEFLGFRLHPLKGDLAGHHGVTVSGNWRLIFRLNDQGHAVDLIDYHGTGLATATHHPPHPGCRHPRVVPGSPRARRGRDGRRPRRRARDLR